MAPLYRGDIQGFTLAVQPPDGSDDLLFGQFHPSATHVCVQIDFFGGHFSARDRQML
jgi:hypothetical protein